MDSRPPHGDELVTLCIVLCWIWTVYLFVFRGSSTCVIVLVGLSDSLVFPLVFLLVIPLVFFVFFAGSTPFVKDRLLGFLPYIIAKPPSGRTALHLE